nr:unnamed protein product [Spirometra erinaceieuropaei]
MAEKNGRLLPKDASLAAEAETLTDAPSLMTNSVCSNTFADSQKQSELDRPSTSGGIDSSITATDFSPQSSPPSCPYPAFSDLPVGERFASVENRTLILRFLCGELAAARKLVKIQPSLLSGCSSDGVVNGVHDSSLSSAGVEDMDDYLRRACIALKRPKPPANIGTKELLDGLFKSVSEALAKCPPGHLGNPMIALEGLSDSQWIQVVRMARLLQNEYNSRRETFIKRADCTVESFKWADKSKVVIFTTSPISGFIAEAVLQRLESLVFHRHKPKFWARYVDDTFVVIGRDQMLTFEEHLNVVFPAIQFTMEEEENNQLAFLDVLVCRKDCGELKTKVFRKATNTMQLPADRNYLDMFIARRNTQKWQRFARQSRGGRGRGSGFTSSGGGGGGGLGGGPRHDSQGSYGHPRQQQQTGFVFDQGPVNIHAQDFTFQPEFFTGGRAGGGGGRRNFRR